MQASCMNKNFLPCMEIGVVENGKTNFRQRKNAQINAAIYERVAEIIISKYGLNNSRIEKFINAAKPPAIKKYINCFEKYNKRKLFI